MTELKLTKAWKVTFLQNKELLKNLHITSKIHSKRMVCVPRRLLNSTKLVKY